MKNLIFIIPLSMVCFGFFMLYAIKKFGTTETYFNSKVTDCNAVLPKDYKLFYNKEKDRYAVGIVTVFGQQYLWAYNGRIDETFVPYTTFSDSCNAKSFALQHIRERQEYENKKHSFK
jgi:hypothetical protein